jgi:hypothetical protein
MTASPVRLSQGTPCNIFKPALINCCLQKLLDYGWWSNYLITYLHSYLYFYQHGRAHTFMLNT